MEKGTANDLELIFKDVNVKVKSRCILQQVSGVAHSGELLAIMGPSGSGKTTLLNAVAGRLTCSSGKITLNGSPLTKTLRRKMCYALQEDCFFSSLTLWETLYFAAMVRLPEGLPREKKLARVDRIIDAFDLAHCKDTIMGGRLVRGVSGGEKKRASIACEFLAEPDIMLLDEPTSGLDSSAALSLMMQLKRLTEKSGKCVITSIHQPSSQIFHMFSQLLLLAEGQVAYFGNASKILTFFEEVGLPCSPCYNPADFILEAVKKDKETLDKILQYAEEKRKSEDWPEKLRRESENLSTTSSSFGINSIMINGGGDLTSICVVNVPDGSEMRQSLPPHWETSFGLQFRMLCWRAFKQSRSHILSKYSIGTSVVVSILVGLLWFQIPRTYDTIRDRMGMLFFSVLFNGFISHQTAAFSFSPERPVVMKERAAGWYRVSAFYFAKLTSEMPLIFLLPSVFFTPTYWMAGLKGTAEFFASWAILLLTCFVAKCFGFIIGTACLNDRLLASVSISFLLSSALAGGFYTQTVPSWLTWVRYLSFVKHSLSALSRLEFSDIPPIPCANVTEQFLHWCADNGTEHVTGEMMLADVGMGLPTYSYVVTLSILLILLYFIGYWTTRIFTRPR